MPRAKRAQLYSLTKTKKKGREGKDALVDDIREELEQYKHVFTFCVQNMRTQTMNHIREKYNTSRFFMGKNKVMMLALGRSQEDEVKPNLSAVSENLVGNCGILMTNDEAEDVIKFFSEFSERDFARSGCVADRTIEFKAGDLPQFLHTMDQYLRKLGMPVMLKKGVINLERDYIVCKKGVALSPEQAQLLKLLDVKMADFAFTLTSHWSDGKVTQLADAREAQRKAIVGRAGNTNTVIVDDNNDDDDNNNDDNDG